jgi:flagellar biosynthesis protein FliQ
MNEVDALELIQSAIWTVIVSSGPAVGLAMAVGIIIALFQAVTQIQEVTLTFVPKIVAVFAAMLLTAPLIASELHGFTELIFQRIQFGF